MTLPSVAREATAGRRTRHPFEPVMTLTADRLVLGSTVLAPLRAERAGSPVLALDGAEARVLALLAVAYGKAVQPRVLGNIRRAERYWRLGEGDLAAIEIALGGLPPLADRERDTARLRLGEELLAEGLSPCELVKLCGFDPAPLDSRKAGFNPVELRVPAGNPDGGQWASDGDGASPEAGGQISVPRVSPVDPNIDSAAYTPVHGLPHDAVVVTTPDGRAIAGPDSKTNKLMAPPSADYRAVYAAGRAISGIPVLSQIPTIRLALAHGGTYDFQRDPRTGHIYHDYTNASNYAVGVYMAAAGYSLSGTEILAESYAFLLSNNYGSVKTMKWIAQGWGDASAGVWK